jgi:hypothetical protein
LKKRLWCEIEYIYFFINKNVRTTWVLACILIILINFKINNYINFLLILKFIKFKLIIFKNKNLKFNNLNYTYRDWDWKYLNQQIVQIEEKKHLFYQTATTRFFFFVKSKVRESIDLARNQDCYLLTRS